MKGTYRPVRRVAHLAAAGVGGAPDVVYVMLLPDGVPMLLSGSAAWIWTAVLDGEPDVPQAVASLVGCARDDIAVDVERYLDELVSRGLLERRLP